MDGAADAKGAAASPAAAAAPKASKPARTECEQGRKWVVENHVGNHEILISDTDPRQAVYIYGCKNSTVQARCRLTALLCRPRFT
jgi:adenylyl cyclase-associated protein